MVNDASEDCMMNYLSVSETARRLGVKPRDISDLFYRRSLDDQTCPIVGGRRMIPADYVDVVAMALRRAGRTVTENVGGNDGV